MYYLLLYRKSFFRAHGVLKSLMITTQVAQSGQWNRGPPGTGLAYSRGSIMILMKRLTAKYFSLRNIF